MAMQSTGHGDSGVAAGRGSKPSESSYIRCYRGVRARLNKTKLRYGVRSTERMLEVMVGVWERLPAQVREQAVVTSGRIPQISFDVQRTESQDVVSVRVEDGGEQ